MKKNTIRYFLTICLVAMSHFAFVQSILDPVECIAPFYHGVASGDPESDKVMIWTRITPTDFGSTLTGTYQVALDNQFQNIVSTGSYSTDSTMDFTVKVDITGLQPNTFYYYEFHYDGYYSQVGRTKTLPVGDIENMRLAIVSCANLESGYFNVYDAIAERNDIDAILMLGDYIYEYESGGFGPNPNVDRSWEPLEEIIGLNDYRLRYNSYKMDPSLRKLHQNYPWICIWDDHETANDSYTDGAQNHQTNEGSWYDRMSNGKKAYFEWIPIRPQIADSQKIFRTFDLGNLAKLIMLDTRLEGRNEQLNQTDPNLNNPDRTILGTEQMDWFKNELLTSPQQWKIIGNQVMVGEVKILGIPINTDSWDGYPADRQRLFDHLTTNNIDNMVVLTGDIHTSWAMNLENANTPVGVEFVTPSVTSPGSPINLSGLITIENTHIEWVELTQKGFVLVDIDTNRVQGDWYFVNTINDPDPSNYCVKSYYSPDGVNSLSVTGIPSVGHGIFNESLAEPCSRNASTNSADHAVMIGIYPNPSSSEIKVQTIDIDISKIEIINTSGERIEPRFASSKLINGVTITAIDIEELPSGNYYLVVNGGKQFTPIKFIKF
jgi:alkaline phosphatase D